MKKLFLSLVAALIASVAMAGTVISQSQLPSAARSFMAKYFVGEKIKKVEKDQGYHGLEYEVDLVSGAEVEFKENGTWKSFKAAPGKSVPAAIIPAGIASYVKANGGGSIVKIEQKRGGYKVKVSNGREFMLNKEGKPYTPSGGRGGKHK